MNTFDNENKKELKKIYKEMNKKKYKDKTDWEKFLNDDRSKYKKRMKAIRENEVLFCNDKLDSIDFN